ncbi:MAG: PhoH family protein [Alistipes sp.]|jgi:phosphate starvation-inducible PhoH-like protein|nr:PhoH family protein [Alistipes sp.]
MLEKEIRLEAVDPRDFYGPGNANLDEIVALSPKVKVIARGSTVKVLGDAAEVERFERRLHSLVDYYLKYHHISREVVRQAFGAVGCGGNAGGGRNGNSDGKTDYAEEGIAKPSAGDDVILFGVGGGVIRAKSKNQRLLVDRARDNDLMFAIGPAGSGKTYTAIALAVRALKEKQVRRIILTRPAVEAGEKLGFLPGDMKEKLDPYLQPLYDALGDIVPGAQLAKYLEEGTVQIAPLAFMRGRTLDNAFVILDEAQNTTLSQIKMFLTRMGPSARFIVTGDLTQIDLPRASDSGLQKALDLLTKVKGIATVHFDEGDIIRHGLVKEIVKAFCRNADGD